MITRKPCAAEHIKPQIDGSLSAKDIIGLMQKHYGNDAKTSKGKGPIVVFTPHAWDELCASVNYGKSVAENELESHYFLEGYYFADEKRCTTTVVTNVVTPYSASQGHTAAELYSSGKTNAYEIVEQKEAELKKYACKGKNMVNGTVINPLFDEFGAPHRVGFGHTHPGLDVFFSSVDKTSVFAASGEPWITMVVDPRKRKILVAVGTNLIEATLFIFDMKERAAAERISVSTNDSDLAALNELLQYGIDANCRMRVKLSGKFPGKLKVRAKIHNPRKKLLSTKH